VFKNLIVYRIAAGWSVGAAEMEAALAKARFVECGATQPLSFGWIEPRGVAHGALAEVVAGQLLLKLATEQKVLPASVVKRRVDAMAAHIEQSTGRKPGKKQKKELKEEAVLELLPQAFTKQAAINVWIDAKQMLLMVDASSPARADEAVTLLVKSFDGLSISHAATAESPAVAMTRWLSTGDAPAGFSIDRECELKSADEMKSVVRYARHPLDTDEVRRHIQEGKLPTKLALTWQGRVSLLLTEAMQIKKIAFLDGVFDGAGASSSSAGGDDDRFDADAAIATGELRQLIPDLLAALGGEQGEAAVNAG
jgi:recombination associated protein RdgC